MPFVKGMRYPKQGGKRERAGRPTKKEFQARQAEMEGLERAKKIMEAKIAQYTAKIAERYVNRALEKKADTVLIDAVRKILPEPKQGVNIGHPTVIIETIDANRERRKKIAALRGENE